MHDNSQLRTIIIVTSTVVVIAFLAALFLTDISTWALLVGAMVILVPAQVCLNRTRDRR